VTKPLLLDLFAGAGGCARGYADAGFDVIGVDNVPQPHYPYEFHQADALTFPLEGFDVIHASPVCKAYSFASLFHPGTQDRHIDFIPAIRARLQAFGKPYVIENVAGAPLQKSIMLCGTMFGLRTYRHRYFESNMLLFQPDHPRHIVKAAAPGSIARHDEMWCIGGHFGQKHEAQKAMGIDWMTTVDEIAQAIPPAYTRWIGEQLLAVIRREQKAAS
jgi:DNA (cytosine-5)-methyltransferase 1